MTRNFFLVSDMTRKAFLFSDISLYSNTDTVAGYFGPQCFWPFFYMCNVILVQYELPGSSQCRDRAIESFAVMKIRNSFKQK